MATLLKFGPADHGRRVTDEEAEAGDYALGYKYEIIDGRLYVSPLPDVPHDWIEQSVYRILLAYADAHPHVINHVTNQARVFVPGAVRTTVPEPDIVAYRDFPHDRQPHVHWQEVSPILVAEVLGDDSEDKDLVRNVELYLRVPSIREYWVFDIRGDAARPTLLVHRRRAGEWRTQTVAFGGVYTTRLVIDPRARN
jgi:Uma2 family endonuclease